MGVPTGPVVAAVRCRLALGEFVAAASPRYDAPMVWKRPLTSAERWQWQFDRAAVLNFTCIARVGGRVDQQRLRDALEVIAVRYPHFTATVTPGTKPSFVAGSGSIGLRVVPWRPGEWKAVGVDEVNTQFAAETGPLVRVVLLDGADSSDLLLTFNHVVADGRSGVVIMDEVLRLHGGEELDAIPQPEVLDPPIGAVLGSRLQAVSVAFRQMRQMYRMTPIPPERWVPAKQRRTGLITEQIDSAAGHSLGREARSRGTTMHGALTAAMLMAIEQEMRSADGIDERTLGCATPLDLRRRSGLSPTAVGILLSGVVSGHRVRGDTKFWELAAEVSGTLRSTLKGGEILALARLQDMTAFPVHDLDKMVATAERFNRTAAIVTNLGRLDRSVRAPGLSLERISGLVSNNANAAASLVLCSTALGGATSLCFTHAEPLLSAERAQRLVDATMARLRAVTP